jgi:two-component system, NarL family, nitrate/nitrite sensor histidine kinase NarQ
MDTRVDKSVTSTIAKAMLLILLLSIVTTSVAIFTLASSLNDAEAINVSGSMRMQSYRLAYDIQSSSPLYLQHIDLFEQSLHSSSMQALQGWIVPEEITQDYNQTITRWMNLKQVLQSEDKVIYLSQVADFVNQVDRFVFKLQRYSEQKLIVLAWVGSIGLGGILLVSVFVVSFIRKEVVKPLKALLIASRRIQNRSFDVVLHSASQNEMGILTRTFNHMARDLGALYRGLEKAVDEKTRKLQHANQSLKVLYDSSQELAASRINHDNFQTIIRHMVSIDGIRAVRLEIHDDDEKIWVLEEGSFSGLNATQQQLQFDSQHLGSLFWESTAQFPDNALIDSFILMLSRAVFYNRAQKQAEQLLLMEERATIARELHDSLAQSLSYLKIQVSLLKRSIVALDNGCPAWSGVAIIADIDDGLSNAYTQLRELLTTFRLSIKEGSFGQALNEMIRQLGEQTDAQITLNNDLSSLVLDANQQVHLLQLIREATLNAIKHAQATLIEIKCRQLENDIIIIIEDNGVGFEQKKAELHHYGMTIMRERAERLGGELLVTSAPNSGCKVTLTYRQVKDNDVNDM